MLNTEKLTQITQYISTNLPPHLSPFKEEISGYFKIALQNVLAKLDLVTREEFDTQIKILLTTREKLEILENQIKYLEQEEKAGRE